MRRGYSLLEAVAALFLLSLITILVLDLLPSTRLTIRQGEDRYQAQLLAQSALAQAEAERFEELVVGESRELDDQTRGTIVFHLERKVQTVAGHDPDRLRRVAVTVRWQERTGAKSITREVYVARVPR
ncbi:MAG: hypothetical protein AB7S38_36990 [Vulcanimicrobiota bacterium]